MSYRFFVDTFIKSTDFPGGSDGKASVYNVGDVGSIPGLGSSLEKEKATLYFCLENRMDGRAWCPWGHKELDTTEQLHFHFIKSRTFSFISMLLRDFISNRCWIFCFLDID